MLVIEKLELVGMVIVLEAPVALLSGMLKPVPVPVKVTALAGRTVIPAIALTVLARTTPRPDRGLSLSNIAFLSIA